MSPLESSVQKDYVLIMRLPDGSYKRIGVIWDFDSARTLVNSANVGEY